MRYGGVWVGDGVCGGVEGFSLKIKTTFPPFRQGLANFI